MNDDIFINVGVDAAIKKYFLFKEKKDASLAGDFLVYTICLLIYLYGDTDLFNPYMNKDGKAFINNLLKYGTDKKTVNKLIDDINRFYELENTNKYLNKEKNDFFTFIQEDLIDLFFAKYNSLKMEEKELNIFRDMLFSAESNNDFKRRINCKYANDLWGSVHYFDRRVYQLNNSISFIQIKKNLLPKDVYKAFDVDAKALDMVSYDEINEMNKKIYSYFNLNPIEANVMDKLQKKSEVLLNPKMIINPSAGKINILIFLSFFGIILFVGVLIGVLMIGGI